ncbi:LysR substrate-binding domain-containing protein [Burkholderia lata]|uniref:LysR substrate-binding domain-containing protein n=1 Tax=Burkholderia lata (strain ATCC 17760 / DSM 23089 / LMG 22485 / NCIMB 9086 / R18194 / 383) TaxID=482957 RepID=UPI001581B5FB|nr:LysR substrate-binding domain-containing protein [Burkholderia lata]
MFVDIRSAWTDASSCQIPQKHPCLRVAINTSDQLTNLIAEHIDLSFRASSTELDDSSLVIRPAGSLPIVLATHPDLIAQSSQFIAADRLDILALITLGTHTTPKTLKFFTSDGRHTSINCTPSLVCNNMSVLQSAVVSGLGAAMLPRYLCAEAISDGTLVNVIAPDSGWTRAPSLVRALILMRKGISLITHAFIKYSASPSKQLLRVER